MRRGGPRLRCGLMDVCLANTVIITSRANRMDNYILYTEALSHCLCPSFVPSQCSFHPVCGVWTEFQVTQQKAKTQGSTFLFSCIKNNSRNTLRRGVRAAKHYRKGNTLMQVCPVRCALSVGSVTKAGLILSVSIQSNQSQRQRKCC